MKGEGQNVGLCWKMLEELPPDIDGEAITPEFEHWFDVNQNYPVKLDENSARYLHHLGAKYLLIYKILRPYLQAAVALFTIGVKN